MPQDMEKKPFERGERGERRERGPRRERREQSEFQEKMVAINRVSKTTFVISPRKGDMSEDTEIAGRSDL